MSKIDQLVKTIVKAIDEKDRKKTQALDTVATVSRIDGDTAWVKFAGSDSETPVKQTIAVKKGDKVQVRASKGNAWITGNITSPPTDNTLAKEAVKKSDTATKRAKRAEDMSIVADVMYYLASDQDEGVTTEDEGWTQEPQEVTESLPYLWAYHDYERGNGKHFKSEPVIIAMYAEDGKGIDTLTTYYALGTSTSTAPTTGWATSFTYLSGYYIWRKELITYDDGTTKWTTAVYDAGLTQSSSLSYDTAQYFWNKSTGGTTAVPTGSYVTEVSKSSYQSNPSGNALLMNSDGIRLRNGTNTVASFLAAGVRLFNLAGSTLAEFLSDGIRIYSSTDSSYPVAQFLSSGAKIGKTNSYYLDIGSGTLGFYSGSSRKGYIKTSGDSGYLRIYGDGSVYYEPQTSKNYFNGNTEINGTLTAKNIDCGSVSITPTANSPTSKIVSFNKTFSSTPHVIISAETSVPGTTVIECGATDITTVQFKAWVYRTNTTATVLHWIAIS